MFGSELLQWLSGHLIRLGPAVLFVVCLLETAIFAGLILPVGALIAFSAMLASRGLIDPEQVVAVALAGALLGDQLGFVVGRWFVSGARPPQGDVARMWAGALERMDALMRRHGLIGISLARATPFVRTIMPWFAGRSALGWGRFFLFDLLGVLLWGTIYIGGGFVVGQGWQRFAAEFGEVAGAVLVAVAVLGIALLTRGWLGRLFRRRRRSAKDSDGAIKHL